MKVFHFFVILAVSVIILSAQTYAEPPQSSDLLWLVNQENRVTAEFTPKKLKNLNGYQLRPEACDAMVKMLAALKSDGIQGLWIQSAYRTYATQQTLFNNKKVMMLGLGYDEDTAAEMASRTVAYPGTSEHQTGLAVDVTVTGRLNAAFADTAAGKWINQNSHTYGFIVRYPLDKTDITQIIYEPWHIRYVGVPHASFMKEKNMCLEEYMLYLKEVGMYLYWVDESTYYKVAYTKNLPPDSLNDVVDVSADRSGGESGYIITSLRNYPRAEARKRIARPWPFVQIFAAPRHYR